MDTSTERISKNALGALCDHLGRRYVTDTQSGTVAIYMDTVEGRAYIRPMHGGPEWTLPQSRLRSATLAEVKAAQ